MLQYDFIGRWEIGYGFLFSGEGKNRHNGPNDNLDGKNGEHGGSGFYSPGAEGNEEGCNYRVNLVILVVKH